MEDSEIIQMPVYLPIYKYCWNQLEAQLSREHLHLVKNNNAIKTVTLLNLRVSTWLKLSVFTQINLNLFRFFEKFYHNMALLVFFSINQNRLLY